jgi:hypothetical protein
VHELGEQPTKLAIAGYRAVDQWVVSGKFSKSRRPMVMVCG